MGQGDQEIYVVVPRRPGALLRPDTPRETRARDDLDDLIDEVFPDTDEGPGWFDAGLVVAGAAALSWAVVTGKSAVLALVGAGLVGLGVVLPLRAVWNRAAQRRARRRRTALLDRGVPLDTSDPVVAELVAAFDRLVALEPELGLAAAHGAVMDVASLLQGRPPSTTRQHEYIATRTATIDRLTAALEDRADEVGSVLDPALVLEAREELDRTTGLDSLKHLDDLIAEIKATRDEPG
ncbi:MAG TPA: hypothetical protein VGJ86_05450 [Acidimicrobiales bacterium]|jgi:hypothetical protein